MCFGIRISSSFHLGTLQIPIQNLKCPKNAKNACPDITLLPSESQVYSKWKHLACFEEEIIEFSVHFQLWSHITVHYNTQFNVIYAKKCRPTQIGFRLLVQRRHSSSFTLDGWGESNVRACVFSIFRAL